MSGLRRRVAITGIGAVTPLGLDAESTWQSCRNGRGGIDYITAFDANHLTTHIAAEVKGFDPEAILGKKTGNTAETGIVATDGRAADSGAPAEKQLSLKYNQTKYH